MKRKVCVKSMFLGAVIMLVGLAVGAIVSPPLIAQRNGVFDEIQCTGIKVVNKHGKVALLLVADEKGNEVVVYDKKGKEAVLLSAIEKVNGVAVYDKSGKGAIELSALETGNQVTVSDKRGAKAVILDASETSNNQVSVWDKHGKKGLAY